jgi:hypothetical protein
MALVAHFVSADVRHADLRSAFSIHVVSADTIATPRFRLGPTPAARGASGWVALAPAQSPFGVAATRDGRLVYDLAITVTDLPPAGDLGAYSRYEVWLTTPKLDEVHDLGPIENNGTVHAQADWNKFTIIVSAEPSAVPRKWGTAIALIGRSPSSLMQSFASHPLFSTPEPD